MQIGNTKKFLTSFYDLLNVYIYVKITKRQIYSVQGTINVQYFTTVNSLLIALDAITNKEAP